MAVVKCNAIHVFAGVDDEGQLYVRREWANSKFGPVDMPAPDDFTPPLCEAADAGVRPSV